MPLLLLFSGTIFAMADGRLQAHQVPWSKEASFRLPISVWREAIDAHFPNSAWIKMSRQTLDQLQQFKTRRALPTWDATLQALLAEVAAAEARPRRHTRDHGGTGGHGMRGGAAMRLDSAHLDHARKVADAILYEGYLLYPYRQSSQKNKIRFQFGVLMPPAYRAIDDCEPSASQTECLIECADDAEIRILVRFLQLQRRSVYGVSPETGALHQVGTLYVDGSEFTGWDEAAEREQHLTASVAALLSRDRNLEFHAGSGETVEDLTDSQGRMAGRLVRQWDGIDGTISLHAERVAGPYQALRLRVRVENHTVPGTELRRREDGLRHALIAAHSLIGVPGGTFLSMTDSPEWATAEIAGCVNTGTWPVLAGPEGCTDLMLSSPVILYDHPEIAPESAGDLFDATEIDEILTLRTMALTESEKREARAIGSARRRADGPDGPHSPGNAGAHARGDPLPAAGGRPAASASPRLAACPRWPRA